MVEQDADDRWLTNEVFSEKKNPVHIEFLHSGEGVIDWLENANAKNSLPHLILLNINLVPDNGMEILKVIRSGKFKYIPVVMLGDTHHPAIVDRCYEMGANSFIRKPSTSNDTYHVIDTFINYWFGVNLFHS